MQEVLALLCCGPAGGGCGLARRQALRGFDLRPPADASLEYVRGDARDPAALAEAVRGVDAVLYMAMGTDPGRDGGEAARMEARVTAFDVNVKGLHLALHAAHGAGVTHAVYTDEDTPPDAVYAYGLTKHLGEEVCRHACRAWGLSVNALRLFFPVPEDKWQAEARGGPTPMTTAEDTARALLAALEYRAGFEAFTISGDYAQGLLNMAKAKRLLGWEPLARPAAP